MFINVDCPVIHRKQYAGAFYTTARALRLLLYANLEEALKGLSLRRTPSGTKLFSKYLQPHANYRTGLSTE